jgi:hypothetical protein
MGWELIVFIVLVVVACSAGTLLLTSAVNTLPKVRNASPTDAAQRRHSIAGTVYEARETRLKALRGLAARCWSMTTAHCAGFVPTLRSWLVRGPVSS